MFRNFLKLVIKVLFGVDFSINLIIYVTISFLANEPFNWFFVFLTVVAGHIPDIDTVPFMLLPQLRKKELKFSHWPFGHHPLIVILLYSWSAWLIIGYFYSHNSQVYAAILATTAIFWHFIHDMHTNPVGIHWLSPFSWQRWRFGKEKFIEKVPREEWIEYYKKLEEKIILTKKEQKIDESSEFISRIPIPSKKEIFLFWIALTLLCFFS